MKKLIVGLGLLAVAAPAHANLWYDTAWGKNCGKSTSFAVKVTNRYSTTKDIRVCLKKRDGDWSCFVSSNVAPGETTTRTWGNFVCDGTGRYWAHSRDAGSRQQFDDPPGY